MSTRHGRPTSSAAPRTCCARCRQAKIVRQVARTRLLQGVHGGDDGLEFGLEIDRMLAQLEQLDE
jgi:hypothetical protein